MLQPLWPKAQRGCMQLTVFIVNSSKSSTLKSHYLITMTERIKMSFGQNSCVKFPCIKDKLKQWIPKWDSFFFTWDSYAESKLLTWIFLMSRILLLQHKTTYPLHPCSLRGPALSEQLELCWPATSVYKTFNLIMIIIQTTKRGGKFGENKICKC